MNEFSVGCDVDIICDDGAAFTGRIEEITDQYFVLSGLGFAHAGVRLMVHRG